MKAPTAHALRGNVSLQLGDVVIASTNPAQARVLAASLVRVANEIDWVRGIETVDCGECPREAGCENRCWRAAQAERIANDFSKAVPR
jgi:hypothetical protein